MRSESTAIKARYLLANLLAILLLMGGGPAISASITVNTATDDFGSVTSNCSLREAIQSANNNADFGGCSHSGVYSAVITDVITLPTLTSGGFTLTRIGTDDNNNSGDLDIDGLLTIQGVSRNNSLIRGNTLDPDSNRHRLVHVIAGALSLRDLTLQDGVEDGATAGGGLRSEPGSTSVLTRVVVTANRAGGNAGGILNRGTMTLNDSLVSNNIAEAASLGGGGLFNSPGASLTLNDTRVLGNTANTDGDNPVSGGGIYSDGALVLDNSVVDGNLADGRRPVIDIPASGGGIYSNGTLHVVQSSVTHNEVAGSSTSGGGIFVGNAGEETDRSVVEHSVISFNLVRSLDTGGRGGGIHNDFTLQAAAFRIEDSVISGNEVPDEVVGFDSNQGGGLSGSFRILRSTIANNRARDGAGMAVQFCEVINSTLTGNIADNDGGAFSLRIAGRTLALRNTTVVGNTAGRRGGGISVDEFQGTPLGEVSIANTVLAGNSAGDSGPDCSGLIGSQGNNLVQTDSGCAFGGQNSDQTGVSANLGPAQNNGGPTAGSSLGIISGMSTRAPLPTSALVDAGNPTGCIDANGSTPLTTDQIGNARAVDGPDPNSTATCDIGAVEYIAPVDPVFASGFE